MKKPVSGHYWKAIHYPDGFHSTTAALIAGFLHNMKPYSGFERDSLPNIPRKREKRLTILDRGPISMI